MKRRFVNIGICVLVFGLVVALNSCGAVGVVTLEDAKIQFIGWIGGQGVGEHAIGQYLGEVSAGDEVGSFNPAALPDGATERGSGPLSENGWLFYVDEWPGSFYSHPGKICVIGKSGQILYSVETQGWPVVNGEKPASMNRTFQEMLADISTTIYNPKEIAIWPEFRWPVIVWRFRTYGAVVVNGLNPGENLYTEASNAQAMMVDAMKKLFNTATTGINYVQDVKYPNNKPANVAAAINDLVENKKVTHIVLYYIAHGNIELMSVGGIYFYASHDGKRFVKGVLPNIIWEYKIAAHRTHSYEQRFCVMLWMELFNKTLLASFKNGSHTDKTQTLLYDLRFSYCIFSSFFVASPDAHKIRSYSWYL